MRVNEVEMSQDFNPPHTIEYRHVIAAVPGDTLRQKYEWLQNAIYDVAVFRDTDAAARRMVDALGDIETVIELVHKGKLQPVKALLGIAGFLDGIQ